MLTEPFFWVVVLVVGPFLLSALWTRLKETRRRRRESRRRAEVSDASARLSSMIRVEQRTAHEQIPGLTDLEKGRLLATYSGCAYCGKPVEAGTNLHWDHVLPLTFGGANHVDTLYQPARSAISAKARSIQTAGGPNLADRLPMSVSPPPTTSQTSASTESETPSSSSSLLEAKATEPT